jgi:hypothetical protein
VAKKHKVEATGEDNGRAHAEFSEGLVNKATSQELGAWLVELGLIGHRDHAPYCYYEDSSKLDPLFETTARWGLDVEAIKASVTDQPKAKRSRKNSAN